MVMPMIQGVLMLYDAETGELLAMMDAEHLTAMRTGAASGVATDAWPAKMPPRHPFRGRRAGGAQLAAVCAVRPIEHAFVVTKYGKT